MADTEQSTLYMIHHVFLPPQLPQQQNSDNTMENSLLDTILDSLCAFKRLTGEEVIESVIEMVKTFRAVRDESGAINEVDLKGALQRLPEKGTIALHVKAQNAGLLISRVADKMHFEAFELSPENESVVGTKGRLKRSFPAFAVSITSETYSDDAFQSTIAQTIAKMSTESVEEMRPQVTKSGQRHQEIRDTIRPDLVTEHLMSFFRACGEPVVLSTVWKNTREEVLWKDALLPWRRSPMWLLVRVSLQLAFLRLSADPSESFYKPFMVFFMSRVLGLSLKLSLESNLIHVMRAKLEQRILKLGDIGPQSWLTEVQDVLLKAAARIESRWKSLISQSLRTPDFSSLHDIQPAQDVLHKLSDLDSFIDSLKTPSSNKVAANFTPTGTFPCFAPDVLPIFPLQLDSLDASFGLVAFESWVEHHLSAWLEQHISDSNTCTLLKGLIEEYHDNASRQYAGNPEASSVVVLTVIELWICCDRSACSIFGILPDYNPGVVQSLLWSLLLPSKPQMVRLVKIERYLEDRIARARNDFPSPFCDFGNKLSFAVRYFEKSSQHQLLRNQIEGQAARDREKKCEELSRLNAEYWRLMQLYDESECQYLVDWEVDIYQSRHDPGCQKCNYKRSAQSLKIRVHEWPLSPDGHRAKATVFELRVPLTYGAWRDITLFVLKTVLQCDYQSCKSVQKKRMLQSDPALQKYFISGTDRIGIQSETKSHLVTHRANVAVPTNEGSVCLNNGSTFKYFDIESGCYTSPFVITERLHELCTFKLPSRSRSLQRFISRTPSESNGLPPNEVIASQAECPDHMTLGEYKAFGTVPIGYENQWTNILTQLAVPAIEFAKPETAILLLQVTQQVGPDDGSTERPSHKALTMERFASALLEKLWAAKERVGGNWESSQAIGTFVSLAARLLSITGSARIEEQCLKFLASCRSLAFSWLAQMRNKIHSSTEDNQRARFATQAVELALVCTESFNVDHEHLPNILATADAFIFIQCCISIQEYLLPQLEAQNELTRITLARWRKLVYRAHPELVHQIVVIGSDCLGRAIHESWVDYNPGPAWRQLPTPHEHWLESLTASDDKPLSVHFNLLTASLLVNGSPLSRLPAVYEADPYSIFFGRTPIQIMPSGVPGFEYSARSEHFGFKIHFGMVSDGTQVDLVLRAIKDGQDFSLVPARVFSGALPTAFTRDFVHWYKHKSGEVLFAPVSSPWPTGPDNWTFVKRGAEWEAKKGDAALVNVSSSTAKRITEIIFLEDFLHMHILFRKDKQLLEIELPRLQLGFFSHVGSQQVWSCQFRGMVIDHDQNIGMLVGLRSKIVLRHDCDRTQHRIVLIPDGSVQFQRNTDHVAVQIERGSGSRAHAYSIDDLLCRIVDNGNLQSKLFLSYLYALTSYCIPDPLTQRTGTEQALSILRSAAVRSFKVLEQGDVDLLLQIASLAPKRSFYPDYLQVMQTVGWNAQLSFLAQDDQLWIAVYDIFAQAQATQFLYPETYLDPPSLNFTERHLLQRDIIRSSTFRVSGFGADEFTVEHDTVYQPRDRGQDTDRARRTFTVARSFIEKTPVIREIALAQMHGYLWNQLKMQSSMLGPSLRSPPASFLYSSQLLAQTAAVLGQKWCAFHVTLSDLPEREKYQVMMWLSTLAFAQDADMLLIYTMLAFYCIPVLAQVTPPDQINFKPRNGDHPSSDIEASVRRHFRQFSRCPESNLPQRSQETTARARERRVQEYHLKKEQVVEEFVQVLTLQWPCATPLIRQADAFSVYINVNAAMADITEKWDTWFQNRRLHQYLDDVEASLRLQVTEPIQMTPFELLIYNTEQPPPRRHISTKDIFTPCPPELPLVTPDSLEFLVRSEDEPKSSHARVESLLASLTDRVTTKQEIGYVDDLRDSLAHLSRHSTENILTCSDDEISPILDKHRSGCKKYVQTLFGAMVRESNPASESANIINQYPRTSPMFYLQQLSQQYWPLLPDCWRRRIVQYAVALTAQQRSERLWRFRGARAELIAELANLGHRNWDPLQRPEWLLLEVEGGIMIREVQADIACQMLCPKGGGNSVMQLNMGEGKTTFIVPCICGASADGTKLVRVVVARPQSKQMFEVLVQRLGGLVNRRIYHLPFSRSLQLSAANVETLSGVYQECMRNGGILLVQPEHVLSFKLMGVECSINGDHELAMSLLRTQLFFDTYSRDIIDECDENFSVKFELVYTMGTPQPIEFSPDRWNIIQHVLNLVAHFAQDVKLSMGSEVVEIYDQCPGRFPRIRLLRPEGRAALLDKIAAHICEYGLPSFRIAHLSSMLRGLVSRYITEAHPTVEDLDQVHGAKMGGILAEGAYNALLLVRGLIAGGVLSFTFGEKRWRVNYGLDNKRLPPTKLAVPFRAKDSPEPRSDFSHTDVLIVLTSLSYYYGGLDDNGIFATFAHLLEADQADVEYRLWVDTAPGLAPEFRKLSGINIKDHIQCKRMVFPALRYSKGAIDYFLANIVFSKEMREFPQKITASGWDLGQVKANITTGFSGTNDSRHLLPLDVKHLHLPQQKHTNALVIKHILEDENSVAFLSSHDTTQGDVRVSDAKCLLKSVVSLGPAVRVIIDVGAQILELNNKEVAQEWLRMWEDDDRTKAAIFFNHDDELSVIDRTGHTQLLQTSPFASQTELCLVFLDDAHTRGTDLRLPTDYCAAVTLGANLTKDKFVQACMRMRKLGKGQSLVFCVSEEIRVKMIGFTRKNETTVPEVADVVSWVISETFLDLRRNMPLWAAQGRRFIEQSRSWRGVRTQTDIKSFSKRARILLEDEAQTLERRYGPKVTIVESGWDSQDADIKRIFEHCREYDCFDFDSANLQEEQERELSPEKERVRQLEKPMPATPHVHSTHPDLIHFATTGEMRAQSPAFIPAFQSLYDSTAGRCFDMAHFPGNLLVTTDFASTINPAATGKYVSDSFQRPVQWVLTSQSSTSHMVIISPFEALKLRPIIREYKSVTLHTYAPRPTLEYYPLDDLDLFTEGAAFDAKVIPQHLTTELNIFAGQLYFSSQNEYVRFCKFLGLACNSQQDGVQSDGFIVTCGESGFRQSPVAFLKLLMTKVRRNCQSIDKTHIGKVLEGGLLERSDFDT